MNLHLSVSPKVVSFFTKEWHAGVMLVTRGFFPSAPCNYLISGKIYQASVTDSGSSIREIIEGIRKGMMKGQ